MTIADSEEGRLTGCFSGLRVIDFSTTIAGPHCARMLADLGAEVIKIETSEGETMRTRPPVRNGCSTVFGQLNAGKKSLVLDLKHPEGTEAIRRLAMTADVLVENFRPGVMRRLKLDYATLSALNPKLIYCSISGYGQTGPSAELPAYAPVIHAASGYDMAHLAYQPGRERPDYCGIYHADVFAGTYAFGAISAALYQRTLTKAGQHIDVSMLEAMLMLTLNEVQWSQFAVPPLSRPMFGPIGTSDGYVMLAIASEKTFQGLVKVIGHPEWVSDPEIPGLYRSSQQLVRADGRRRGVVAHADHGEVPGGVERRRRAVIGLSHRCRGARRSPTRASPGACGGRRQWREIPRDEPALPDVGREGRRGQAGIDFGRTYPRAPEGDRLLRGANRGVFGETACRRADLTPVLPLAPIPANVIAKQRSGPTGRFASGRSIT